MQDYYRIAEALTFIKNNMQQQPTLEEIARQVHISPFHFQRMFTEWAGVSPKKFLHYLSVEHAKSILQQQNTSVYDAAFAAGLSGTGRLHDLFVKIEGMTPGEYKNGGRHLTIQYSLQQCQFGNYLVASTATGICNLLFFEQSAAAVEGELRLLWPQATIIEGENNFHHEVRKFFDNDSISQLKLHLKGTHFQLKVWEALLKIPTGQLRSYQYIADEINKHSAQRAVGSAIGSNPVGFIIPCHRVIRSVGGIGEYRWKTERKMAMTGWEASKINASTASI